MDTAVNEALWTLNTANLRRYTDLQCPKARRRRLKAVQRLVRVPLGDPNVVCGTNTKGKVCFSGGACTALSGPLGGHLALTAQEHEALSRLRMACSMHLSQRALLRMPRRCTQRDLRTVRQRIMPYFPQTTIVKSTTCCNRAAAHVPLQSIVQNAISMDRVIGKPPPSGVAIVVISVDATSLWKASSTRVGTIQYVYRSVSIPYSTPVSCMVSPGPNEDPVGTTKCALNPWFYDIFELIPTTKLLSQKHQKISTNICYHRPAF